MRFIFAKQRVQKARRRGRPARLHGEIKALGVQMEKAVSIDVLHGITTFKAKVSPTALRAAFDARDYKKVMATIPFDALPDDLSQAFGKLPKAAAGASQISINALPAPIERKLRYDVKNPRIDAYLSTRTGELIQRVTSEVQARVQVAVRRTMTHAASPRNVAEDIRSSIGLNDRQAMALSNYKLKLAGQEMDPSKATALSDAYESRLLDQRAIMIGRTETAAAMNYGQQAVWQEAKDQGLVSEVAQKVWYTDGADPCDVCAPMDGIGVPVDEPWTILEKNGPRQVMVPSESHPNCRCSATLDVTGTSPTQSNEESDA